MKPRDLFYEIPDLNRVSELFRLIRIVPERKENNAWVRIPESENAHICRILEEGGDNSPDLLAKMWMNYAAHGMVVVYKVKSNGGVLAEAAGATTFNFKDRAVAGLEVLNSESCKLDESQLDGSIQGIFILVGMDGGWLQYGRSYLKPAEYIYVTDQNPVRGGNLTSMYDVLMTELNHMIAPSSPYANEAIAAVFGVPFALIEPVSRQITDDMRLRLISRCMEDTVIPLASRFVDAIERQLGLPEDMRLVLDYADVADTLLAAWDKYERMPQYV